MHPKAMGGTGSTTAVLDSLSRTTKSMTLLMTVWDTTDAARCAIRSTRHAARQSFKQLVREHLVSLPMRGGCAVTHAGGLGRGGINLPSPPSLSFGVEPQGLAPGLQQGVPGPPQAPGLAGPPQAPGVGVLAPPVAAMQPPPRTAGQLEEEGVLKPRDYSLLGATPKTTWASPRPSNGLPTS
jgi:hypothetical protein